MVDNRKDSMHVQTELMREAVYGVKVPYYINIREKDWGYFLAIHQARAIWTDIDLKFAADLAACMSDSDELREALDRQGFTVTDPKGKEVMNPIFSALEQTTRRMTALSRQLQVHAAATIGEPKDNRGKNAMKRDMAEQMGEFVDDDDLIAKPSPH